MFRKPLQMCVQPMDTHYLHSANCTLMCTKSVITDEMMMYTLNFASGQVSYLYVDAAAYLSWIVNFFTCIPEQLFPCVVLQASVGLLV